MIKSFLYIVFISITVCLSACTGKNISGNYYVKHKPALDSIERSYKKLYREKPFTLAFTDKSFNTVSLEIITDSMSYIYEFDAAEQRLADTLNKFNFQTTEIETLVKTMQRIKCTWLNNFDYYVNDKQHRLIFMSIKPFGFRYPFMPVKYYILAFFFEPQNFDDKGRLLDREGRKRLRKINDAVFRKIEKSNRVCYTIGEKYR
ncbi:MAG: hypothetical protein ABIP30_12120 [Ferruginibacter sp.]